MINYLLTSFFLHAIILAGLLFSPVSLNTSAKIEVNIVENHKKQESPPLLPTSPKSLIPSREGGKVTKHQEIDMSEYANQLKAIVDPIWYRNIHEFINKPHKRFITIVLLFLDNSGSIKSVRVVKRSGNSSFDNLAIQTFRESGQLPIPPELLIKEGIEWTFEI